MGPIETCLTDAKNNIVIYGWRQNESGNRDVGFCSVGAFPCTPDGTYNPNFRARQLFKEANNLPEGMVAWNDTLGRTKQEVLDGFDRAIALAKERKV